MVDKRLEKQLLPMWPCLTIIVSPASVVTDAVMNVCWLASGSR
jgi:hypothetical protein